jgi:TetR/AcrR family fatty acid metabolism transcriptional regulator
MARLGQGERVRSILDAALAVFAQSGYHGARMSDIARAAAVADGTVYLYFRNKRELLVAAFRQGFAGYLEGLEAALAGAPDARVELSRLVRFHLAFLGERRALARVAQVELRQSDPEVRAAVHAVIAPYFRRMDAIVARGRAEGVLRADVDPRVVRRMVFGTLDECVSAWVDARHPYPLTAVADDVERLLLGGIEA